MIVVANSSSLIGGRWIIRRNIGNLAEARALQTFLDYGEAEVIVLSEDIDADLVVFDNLEARKTAQSLGFRVIGTIGILKYAYQKGLVSDLKGAIDELVNKGFWISKALYQRIISDLTYDAQ